MAFLVFAFLTLMAVETYGSLFQFRLMINYLTGKLPILSHSFYGCYCGAGGSGWPKDAIDWCCQVHDCCYGRMSASGCDPYFQPYNFSYINKNLQCVETDTSGCPRRICECDRLASICFQQHDATYNSSNIDPKRKGCGTKSPPCPN
uniref:Phospholipase A2 n=2 Tax=Pithecopus azureus TaxID=2034991 RepID=PA2_PITAZ|nr:RecName: Full=Phospholipase A2; AltName: Full=Pa-PLA2; AltName: Full=Phosphatidylcholine 2-acylhydrolase; Flags: Precursor [Pithecopus azureus]QDS02894.1 phospholipase a2 [Pithecopus azureus]